MKPESRTASAGTNTHSGASAQSAVAREYHALLSDLEHLIGSATSMSGEEMSKAKASLAARIDAARTTISQASDAVMDRARRGARATDEFVTERPWQSVGIVAVAGLLVGFLMGRRSS